jgi:predicted HD phosphohydrolase
MLRVTNFEDLDPLHILAELLHRGLQVMHGRDLPPGLFSLCGKNSYRFLKKPSEPHPEQAVEKASKTPFRRRAVALKIHQPAVEKQVTVPLGPTQVALKIHL